MDKNEVRCEFTIDADVFKETPTQKIKSIGFVVEYENPQAYGYPEVYRWKREFKLDVNKMRSSI